MLAASQRQAHIGSWELALDNRDDPRANSLRWSDETFRIFGYVPGAVEVTSDLFFSHVHPDDRAEIVEKVKNALRTGVDYELEHRIVRADNRLGWVHGWGTIESDDEGRPVRMLGTTQDVTERRIAEQLLREREDLLRLITDAVPALIAYVDTDFRYHLANRTHDRWLHIDTQTLPGRRVRDVLGEQTWRRIQPHMERAARGEEVTYDSFLPFPNGSERWVRVSCTPVRTDGEVRGVVVLASDIEDQKRAEEILRRAAADADAANRAKDEFLAMLGHELRNPLAPIITACQIMKRKGDVPATKERTIIERQSQHLLRLVDDLLDIARITRGKIDLDKKPHELATIIAKAVEMASPLFEVQRHTLDVDVPPGLVVEGDETRLVQVFANLLTNAAKYTPAGGCVWVMAQADDDRVRVIVRDNGVGIAPHVLPRLFELFVQGPLGVDRRQGGLGLGLALVHRIVELHGGTVSAHSDGEGRGTTIEVRLPLAVSSRRGEPIAQPTCDDTLGRHTRVLVVDDNVDAANLLSELLGESGYDVAVAHDAPQALDLAPDFRPEVALLDIGLPVIDGYELAARLRAELREHTPVLVAVTGYGQESDRRRSREAGFARHMVKPLTEEQILGALAELSPR